MEHKPGVLRQTDPEAEARMRAAMQAEARERDARMAKLPAIRLRGRRHCAVCCQWRSVIRANRP